MTSLRRSAGHWWRRLGATVGLALALLAGGGSHGAVGPARAGDKPGHVAAVRFSAASGHTRLVFDLERPATCAPQLLTEPDRLILDVSAPPGEGLRAVTVNSDLVARVRLGEIDGGRTRFVVDLRLRVDYRVLTLAAEDGRPDRLVVDLFAAPGTPPAGTVAPPSRPPAESPPSAAPDGARRNARRRPDAAVVRTVVVDAGHGGRDPGAGALKLREKDVCLAVATQLVRELNRRPGFRASLTRDDDTFIPLRGRSAVAEKRNADAFISIHANASRDPAAHGTEVYFLSLSGATDEASRKLAQEENAADARAGVAPTADDDLSSILFDMQQTEVLHRGSLLAQSVVSNLAGWNKVSARGVKQAGFVVLKSPRIPSILVETAFITNPAENRLLASGTFQRELARRLANGVVAYFTNVSVAEARP